MKTSVNNSLKSSDESIVRLDKHIEVNVLCISLCQVLIRRNEAISLDSDKQFDIKND